MYKATTDVSSLYTTCSNAYKATCRANNGNISCLRSHLYCYLFVWYIFFCDSHPYDIKEEKNNMLMCISLVSKISKILVSN